MYDFFSRDILDVLFSCDKDGCLLSTESYDIEYKQNLNISPDLFKTMNGLANNRGGYIICGIDPSNRKMNGLNDDKVNYYKANIDSEEMRGRILSSCQPNIDYKHYLHNVGTSKFVIFYIPESRNKPHIFMNSMTDVVMGDIFYRYNDSVKKIQYAELSHIIEEKRVKEQEKWMRFLGEIAKIGLDNVLIIDANNGKMISTNNFENGIKIDESVLSKFKLIKEGHFNEITGDPTLKLIGSLSFKTDSGNYELSTDFNSILDVNQTHPYRYMDIFNKLKDDEIETKDGKLIRGSKVTYHRIMFYIKNNKLDNGIENVHVSNIDQRKIFTAKVYESVKMWVQNTTLEELENYRLIKSIECLS